MQYNMEGKIKIGLCLSLVFFCLPFMASAQELKSAYIQVDRLDWQTYEFSARTNLMNNKNLDFIWEVDGTDFLYTPKFQYVFSGGSHVVSLIARDALNNIVQDKVKVQATFFTPTNPWLWWFVYLSVVILIIYYWISKVGYLSVRRKFTREAQDFLDLVFDEHSLVSKIIELEIKKIKKK